MPPRFVEVVDVGAEASSTIAKLLASGEGLVGHLSFNVTDYLNTTYGRDSLLTALASYGVTPNWDDWEWAGLAASLDIAPPELDAPRGAARHLLSTGIFLMLTRELFVRWRIRKVLRAHGHHYPRPA